MTDAGVKILAAVLGFWLIMRSVTKDATGRTLIDHIIGQAGGANQTLPTGSSSPIGTIGGGDFSTGTGQRKGSFGALVSDAAQYAGPDQGIDFTTPAGKAAAVFAPADLKITRVDTHSGWPGGGLIAAQVQSGPEKGRYVYFAESVRPVAGLAAGSVVPTGQQFATFSSSYPGIEAGFARDARGTAYGTVHDGKPGGPTPIYGIAFGNWIKSIANALRGNPASNAGHGLVA